MTAALIMACMFSGVEPHNGDWKKTLLGSSQDGEDPLDHEVEALVSICIQVMNLIAEKKASDSQSVRKIRTALEALKRQGDGGASPRRPPPPPDSNKRQKV